MSHQDAVELGGDEGEARLIDSLREQLALHLQAAQRQRVGAHEAVQRAGAVLDRELRVVLLRDDGRASFSGSTLGVLGATCHRAGALHDHEVALDILACSDGNRRWNGHTEMQAWHRSMITGDAGRVTSYVADLAALYWLCR